MKTYEEFLQLKGLSDYVEIISEPKIGFKITSNSANSINLAILRLKSKYDNEHKIIVDSDYFTKGLKDLYTDYSNCEFHGQVDFEGQAFVVSTSFNKTIFREEVSFSEAAFERNVRFHQTIFKKQAKFSNTTFKKLVDFYFSEFHEDQQFHLTDFDDKAIFSNVKFKKSIQFLHNKVKTNTFISFENAQFEYGLDISRSNFWCTVQFWGAKFDKKQTLKSRKSKLYQNDGFASNEQVGEIGASARLRESFRIVKSSFISSGNHIEARKFHRLELRAYQDELCLSRCFQRIDEKLLLWLNKWSNDHGLSWSRGLLFTLLTTLLCFTIYLSNFAKWLKWDFSNQAVWTTIKHYIELLNLTKWDYQPFGLDNEPYGYTILFISRIFIGYGYYQLVQAFRKYGKN